jgi:hypothetical protein
VDRGHNWLPVPIIGLDTDYGLTIGAGIQLNKYNFRMIPQEYMQQLTVSYATRFGNFAAAYDADYYSVLRGGRLNLFVAATEQFITRYFGYGNETSYDAELEKNNYYETNQTLITFFPTLFYNFTQKIIGNFGISFIHTKTSIQNDTLLSDFRFGEYGLGELSPFGIHFGLEINNKDSQEYPLNGYLMNFNGKIFPAIHDIPETFYFTGMDLRTYFTPYFANFATIAVRAGGSKVFGKYPFYAGATVGGNDNLRGYNNKRFSGDAAVFGQAEIRFFIYQINLLLKSKIGVNLFVETGRVFAENNSSDKWHPCFGVGLWAAYLNSAIIGLTYVAFSPERTTFNMGIGMDF